LFYHEYYATELAPNYCFNIIGVLGFHAEQWRAISRGTAAALIERHPHLRPG
jgi:hypothetical protein